MLPDFHRAAKALHERVHQASKVVTEEIGRVAHREDPERFDAIMPDFLRDPGSHRGANGADPRPELGGIGPCGT